MPMLYIIFCIHIEIDRKTHSHMEKTIDSCQGPSATVTGSTSGTHILGASASPLRLQALEFGSGLTWADPMS